MSAKNEKDAVICLQFTRPTITAMAQPNRNIQSASGRLKRWFEEITSKIFRRNTYIMERRIVIQIRWTSHTNEWDVIEELKGILSDDEFRFSVCEQIQLSL